MIKLTKYLKHIDKLTLKKDDKINKMDKIY